MEVGEWEIDLDACFTDCNQSFDFRDVQSDFHAGTGDDDVIDYVCWHLLYIINRDLREIFIMKIVILSIT